MAEFRTPHSGSLEFQTQFGTQDHTLNPLHKDRFDDAVELLERVAPQCESWVDLGCGQGGLLMRVDVPHKRGFDFWPAAVAEANAKGRPVFLYDFVNEPIPDTDVISMTEVLEHLDEPRDLLRRLECRWLVVSAPVHETEHNYDPAHVWVWDEVGFLELVEDCGFRVVEHKSRGIAQTVLAVPA